MIESTCDKEGSRIDVLDSYILFCIYRGNSINIAVICLIYRFIDYRYLRELKLCFYRGLGRFEESTLLLKVVFAPTSIEYILNDILLSFFINLVGKR